MVEILAPVAAERLSEAYTAVLEQGHSLYRRLFDADLVARYGEDCTLEPQQDALALVGRGVAYVRQGSLTHLHDQRIVRYYSAGDFILGHVLKGKGLDRFSGVIRAELPVQLVLFSEADWYEALVTSGALEQRAWVELLRGEVELMEGLAAELSAPRVPSEITFRQFAEGEVIIRQGASPDTVYELESGTATVHCDEVQVGVLEGGVLFGEISFLTDTQRSATVVAATPCRVREISKEDFLELVRVDPKFVLILAKTLAQRVLGLDHEVIAAKKVAETVRTLLNGRHHGEVI